MVAEMVALHGLDFVDGYGLGASCSNESRSASAGVGCSALTTIVTCCLADRLVAECTSVSGLAFTRCLFRDNNAFTAVTASAAAVGYFASGSGVRYLAATEILADTDSSVLAWRRTG
jgi:hypothetical protein